MNIQPDPDLEAEWAQDMDNISMASFASYDSDILFTEQLSRRKQQQEEFTMRAADWKDQMLDIIKNNEENNNEVIEEFEFELPQLKKITKGEQKNVIEQQKIREIKEALTKTVPAIVLQDQVVQRQRIVVQQQKLVVEPVRENHTVVDQKEVRLQQKMEKMFQDRELIQMHREDKRSLKFEIQHHKSLFNERFYTPDLANVYTKSKVTHLPMPEICYTYTNLAPQMNNQENTLSKHSPILALQALTKLSSFTLKPMKTTIQKVVFKRNYQPPHNPSLSTAPIQSNSVTLPEQILEFFSSLNKSLARIQDISKSYKPKFIQDHLDEEERGQNFSLVDDESKTFKSYLETVMDYDKVKQLRVTFQNLTDIKYIETLKNVEYVSLKHNLLTSIQPIVNNQLIIELDLSHNRIVSMEGLQYLSYLRHLFLGHNSIQSFVELQCPFLQVLNLSHNKMRRINGLTKTINLRSLDVSHNRLEDLKGLSNLPFLDNLNISHNKIEQFAGIHSCLLLKTLQANNNQIRTLGQLILMFLNRLVLNNNQLCVLGDLFLPSLEQLYLDYNKVTEASSKIYLPKLKVLNLDHNKLRHFSPIWKILRHSVHIEVLKYDNNEQLSYLPATVIQLYEYMIYNKMGKLSILNQNPCNIGTKRYYQSQYQNLIEPSEESHIELVQRLSSKINLVINENKFIQLIQRGRDEFRTTNEFIFHRSVNTVDDLKDICSFINSSGKQVFHETGGIFHKYDLYQIKRNRSLHLITGMVVRFRYRRQKRAKYFKSSLPRIKSSLLQIQQEYRKYQLTLVIGKFSQISGETRKNRCMDNIKGSWLKFRSYTKAKRLIKNMRGLKKKQQVDSEDDDLEQLNLDFLEKQHDYSIKFTIPDYMNFQQLIYKPQVFQKAQEIVQNAMIYEESEVSSQSGTMSNTSSTTGNKYATGGIKPIRKQNKKQNLPPLKSVSKEVQRVKEVFHLDNDAARLYEANLRMKNQRLKNNQKNDQYLYQKNKSGSNKKY